MSVSKQTVMADIVELLAQLASDWEYDGAIDAQTLLFSDLGFQSLDAVILGNSLQERYGRVIPYADLLAAIGERPLTDVTVGEWVEFTYRHLAMHDPEVLHEH
jgi:acyl carrier protein